MDEKKIAINGDQLQKMFDAMKDSIDVSMADKLGALTIDIATLKAQQSAGASQKKIDELTETINGKIKEMGDQFNQFVEDARKNQKLIDELAAQKTKFEGSRENKGSFASAWGEDILANMKEKSNAIEALRPGDQPIKMKLRPNNMELKTIMQTSNALSGTGYTVFNERAGIVPAQAINFRDLLSTVQVKAANYITYRETNTIQSLTTQTEGSAKANLAYVFTAQTATLKYIAGFVTFTKQLLYSEPFLQNTLPNLMLRDFYKKENDYIFKAIASNSTGTSTPAGTLAKADAEELIQVIASQRGANFNADFGIIDWTEWQRLLTTKPNDYSVPGGVMIDANGIIRIAGVPIIPASWAQTDHALVLDGRYYERAEGDSLNVQFSYENQDNFEKNQVTARIECFEELNRLRDDASIYYDFGNS